MSRATTEALPGRVKIIEVGPRDGLQNEAQSVSIADKLKPATEIAAAVRDELGKRLELIDDNVFKFCWIFSTFGAHD